MIQISVVIITLNEERNIGRCLESVQGVADEIVIVDSLSTDKTIAIAEGYGARIISQPFLGYGRQKNFATSQATHDWILQLDADEVLTPELEKSILAAKIETTHNAYWLSRLTNYCGRWIKHCGWYPDAKIRLYNRTKGEWKGERIHERWELNDANETAGKLSGDLLHYSYYTISDHITQVEKFTEISSREAVEKGKNCSLLKIWLGPKWRFFTYYIIRLGILDGYEGYLVCKYSAYGAFVKYTKIRQYARLKKEGKSF